ncbi:hypothetical protein K7432_011259 [Basidiobolus ranarum]|uniref:BHLH domain-containing protein n=1 Tax=Basidiobolus ranarum TaxID=34480 RepID=A0ABR2VV52_9FUNG
MNTPISDVAPHLQMDKSISYSSTPYPSTVSNPYSSTSPNPYPSNRTSWPTEEVHFRKQQFLIHDVKVTSKADHTAFHSSSTPFASYESSYPPVVGDYMSNSNILDVYPGQGTNAVSNRSPAEEIFPAPNIATNHFQPPSSSFTGQTQKTAEFRPLLPEDITSTGVPRPSGAHRQDSLYLRKMNHRTAEQHRRDSFKSSLAELRMLIPRTVHSKANKLILVKQAVDHILHLQGELQERNKEIERLRHEIEQKRR